MMVKEYANETYGSLIRKYADGVESGSFDTDLDTQTRAYVVALLRKVTWPGPTIATAVVYPPSDRSRDDLSTELHLAYSAASFAVPLSAEPAWHAAIVRAVEIIRNV